MEIITEGEQRFIAVGTIRVPITRMILDINENTKGLTPMELETVLRDGGVDLPDGMDPAVLLSPARSFVQNAWYQAQTGAVPETIKNNHAGRLATLQAEIVRFKDAPPPAPRPAPVPKAEKAPKAPKAPKEPKASKVVLPKKDYLYQVLPDAVRTNAKLAAALDMKAQPVSHDGIILQELYRIDAPVSFAEIVVEVQLTKRYESNDPLEKSVKWHLGKLVERGYVKATEAV